MTHDHVAAMRDALLAVPLPDGFTSAYQERHDTVIDHTFRDVTISPDGLDVSTFTFGTTGAYAHISLDGGGDTYTVGVWSTHVSYNVQSAGHVVAFTTAQDAVTCALDEIRDAIRGQLDVAAGHAPDHLRHHCHQREAIASTASRG